MKGQLTQLRVPYDQYNHKLFYIGMEVEINCCKAYVCGIQLVRQDDAKIGIIYTFEELEN